jgi:superfamily II DNA or RNA helicase
METIVMHEIKNKEQKKALNAWAKGGYNGSIIAGTGFGKSRCGVLAVCHILDEVYADWERNPPKALILVPTTQLQDQFEEEFIKWGKEMYLKDVEILCYQSAYKLKHKHYNIVVCDEVHLGLSPQYRKFFKNNSYQHLLCMTATLPEEEEYCTLLEQIAPVNYSISLDKCVSLGLVSPYEIHCVPVKLTDIEQADYKKVNNKFVYWKYQLGNFDAFNEAKRVLADSSAAPEMKQAAAQFYACIRARKKIVDFASQKIYALQKIVVNNPEEKILVFGGANAFTNELAEATEPLSTVYHSGKTKKQKEQAIKDFKDGTKPVLCSTKALNQGFDVPDAGIGVICGLTSKSLSMVQRVGRLIRFQEDKVGKIFILYVKDSQEEKWLNNSVKTLKNVIWH